MMNDDTPILKYGTAEGEAPERERRRVSPILAGQTDNYVATGESETVNYFGSYATLAAKQEALAGTKERRITSTLTRNLQGVWTLRVETAAYTLKQSDGGGGAGDDGGAAGGDTPESEVSISVNCDSVPEPLLTNPLFKGLDNCSDDVMEALNLARNGARLSAKMRMASGKETTVGAVLRGNKLAMRAFRFFARGVTEYYVPHTKMTCRQPVSRLGDAANGLAGQIAKPPGSVKPPVGQKWLCTGEGYEQTGKVVFKTSVYEAGNWLEELYKTHHSL